MLFITCLVEGGAITSHQLSLQPGTANRKVSNVAAGEKIREKNPENSKAIFGGGGARISFVS